MSISAFKTQEMFYKFNETWSMEYGKGMGVMWNFCTREAVNVILCRCEEREKDWRISSKLTFTDSAMVNERTFHNKNIGRYFTFQSVLGKGFILQNYFQLLKSIMRREILTHM